MNNIFSLKGKVALVTGASSGLGKQFAKILIQYGAKVALLARRKDKLSAVAEELKVIGGDCLPIIADVTSTDEIKQAVTDIVNHYGRIDILANNAGTSAVSPAEAMTDEDWKKVIDVNLSAVFRVAREVGKQMVKQKYGKIINTSSMFGVVANTAFPVVNYHAAKFGVVGLTKQLAAEWAKYNITVNAIGPGFFESEMTASAIKTTEFQQYVKFACPMKRIGNTGELDGTILLLASDASSYLTGQIICVDGGWTAV